MFSSEQSYIEFANTHCNWGRWGEDDEIGTLNLIDDAKRVEAGALIREGEVISCSRTVEWGPKVARAEAPVGPLHFMMSSGEAAKSEAHHSAYDWIGLPIHGLYLTHLDAPSHVFWDRRMYNGRDSSIVATTVGAGYGSVEHSGDGIVSRGILLDIAATRGVEWLEDSESVEPEDLEAAEALAETQVREGDIVYIRTGYGARRLAQAPSGDIWKVREGIVGLSPECATWLWERTPSVLATDCGADRLPSRFPNILSPIHVFAIVFMGMWLVDNCDLERLSERLRERERYEFCTVLAPLRLKRSTGSPLNPIAIL